MLQICLDGPSGSGKSTVAKHIAKALAITYLDTGAMYRALTYICLEKGIDVASETQVVAELGKFELSLKGDCVTANGQDVTDAIRTERVSQNVSAVSSYQAVREAMVDLQRSIASQQPIVMDGRDIGTVVLPKAPYKFFITASAEERAMRRFKEQTAKGLPVEYQDILKDMVLRDQKDSSRAIAPLKAADDAIHVDTSSMNLDEVVAHILSFVRP